MYQIKHDLLKNRLFVTLKGSFTPDEIKKCANDTIVAANRLRKGYSVVTDISELKIVSPEITKEIERVQQHFALSGARIGVRIVGESVITGMQFKRLAANAKYTSVNVLSFEEAEKLLDSIEVGVS